MPGWEKFLFADWHRLRRRCIPEFMTLYTSAAYNNLPHKAASDGLSCQCRAHQGGNASTTPQKETPCVSPCLPSHSSHPPPQPAIVNQAAYREILTRRYFTWFFFFLQEFEPGLPKTYPWRSLDQPLTIYITIPKWKCLFFFFLKCQKWGAGGCSRDFQQQEIKQTNNPPQQQQCSKLWDNLNVIHLTPALVLPAK